MILLTGGLGFIGCSLAYYLAKQGEKVLLTQHRTSRIPSFLQSLIDKQVWITPCNLLDLSSIWYVMESYPVESVIHAANALEQKGYLYQALNINIIGTMNILEASRIKKIGKVMFTSSQSVYPRGEKRHREDDDLPLKSPHTISLTKKVGDMICNSYAGEYGMAITITRPCMIYGPLYVSGRNALEEMVENTIAGKKTELPHVNPKDGNNLMYVKDCARALALIHLKEKPEFPIYNVGDRYFQYGEMAETVRRIVPTAEISLGPDRGETPSRMFMNLDRLTNEFGFKPEYDLESGVRDYMQWLRNGEY